MKVGDENNLRAIRRSIVDVGFKCGQSAHFGGGLSIVELLYVLYKDFLRIFPEHTHDPKRDIFILSKGHGVLGLYAILHFFEFIPRKIFESFQSNGSPLIAHPVRNYDLGIESSNGSLGQGLAMLSGMALASNLRGENRRFFTLMGDGECNEGSGWEAAMFCSQQALSNVVAIIDNNGFQNDDSVENISSQRLVARRWAAFGWNVIEIDGHDVNDVSNAFDDAIKWSEGPSVVIANTIKGKGVSFMEGDNDWHHNRLTSKTYEQALMELGIGN
jgi:transketolase